MEATNTEFSAFLKQREAASLDYVRGRAEPFMKLVSYEHDASYFPPIGGYTKGTLEVARKYENDAATFGAETRSSRFEVFHAYADDELGYWTGLQHAEVKMRGRDALVPMKLRVTEVFRKDGGEWRIIHRHADMLSDRQN